MGASTVLGAVVAQLNAAPALTGSGAPLFGKGVWAGEEPSEIPDPPAVILSAKQLPPEWLTQTSRKEFHEITARIYAGAATAVGAPNPTQQIADLVEGIIDWTNLGLMNTATLGVKRGERPMAMETKRTPGGERAWKIELRWTCVLWVNGVYV